MTLVRLPARSHLEYVTPSGAAALAQCPLRVAYGLDPELRKEVPSSPAARLGDVCHSVLEAAGRGQLAYSSDREEWKARFDAAWHDALAREVERSRRNPLESHWPVPERWPNFAVRKLTARRLCQVVAAAAGEEQVQGSVGAGRHDVFEASQEAFEGRLRGRADVVRRSPEPEIEDYKTGTLFEDGTGEVKSQYRVQMLLYAVLQRQASGTWPRKATLVPLEGERVSIPVDPAEAMGLAEDALLRLEHFNRAVDRGDPMEAFARPAAVTCRFCGYAVVCPEFWSAAGPEWGESGLLALRGECQETRDSQVGTFSIDVFVSFGTIPTGVCTLAQLDAARFDSVREAGTGSEVGAVFLRGDPLDRALRATQRSRIVASKRA